MEGIPGNENELNKYTVSTSVLEILANTVRQSGI